MFCRIKTISILSADIPVYDDLDEYLCNLPAIPPSFPSPSRSPLPHDDHAFIEDLMRPIEFTPIKSKPPPFPTRIVYEICGKHPHTWKPLLIPKKRKRDIASIRKHTLQKQALKTIPSSMSSYTFGTWESICWDWYLRTIPMKNKIQENHYSVQMMLEKILVKDNLEATFRNVQEQFIS